MKQLVIALIIALTLSGCGQAASQTASTTEREETTSAATEIDEATSSPAETTETTAVTAATQAAVPSTAESDASAPVSTAPAQAASPFKPLFNGAVSIYETSGTITGMTALGDKLLVCTNGTTLSLLDGTTLEVLKQKELESEISWGSSSFVIAQEQFGYFDPVNNCYVVLNSDLVPVSTTVLPIALSCDPVISSDFKTIYYLAQDTIRALDLTTGISRILRQEHTQILSLDGLLFDNEILRYVRMDAAGSKQTCFINAQNGSICYTSNYDDTMIHWDDWYASAPQLEHPMGDFQGIITGERDGTLKMLRPERRWDNVISPGNSLIVTQTKDKARLVLNCYQLKTGDMTAEITLAQPGDFFTAACAQGELIWLWNPTDRQIYRWDTSQTLPAVPVSIMTDFTSITAPREDVLSLIDPHIQSLQYQYGVDISFVEQTNRTQGMDYSTVPDYRPDMYQKALDILEGCIKRFPKDFLKHVGARTIDGKLQIQLVDDYDPIVGDAPGSGSCEFADGGIVIRVSIGPDLEKIFCRELGYAIITRIISRSSGLDQWSELNPKGFQYTDIPNPDSPYLASGANYFMDTASMQSSRDDQAMLFAYSMLPDQKDRFSSAPIQKKLALLSKLIRSTYEIDAATTPPWEIYLDPTFK